MTTSIREATPQDMEALIGLLYESDVLHWNALPDHFGAPGKPVRVQYFVKHLLDEENGVILVAERNEAILGLVQLAVFDVRSGPHLGGSLTPRSATSSSPASTAARA